MNPRHPSILVLGLILCAAAVFITGCKTVKLGEAATPERIEAVTTVGAYFGAKELIAKGHRADVERALEALRVSQSTGKTDLMTVAQALEAAGVTSLQSEEGMIVFAAIVTFTDLWAGTAQPILDDARAKAVVTGVIGGFKRALAWNPSAADIEQKARSTRSAR